MLRAVSIGANLLQYDGICPPQQTSKRTTLPTDFLFTASHSVALNIRTNLLQYMDHLSESRFSQPLLATLCT